MTDLSIHHNSSSCNDDRSRRRHGQPFTSEHELVAVHWHGIAVQQVEHGDGEHGAGEHGSRPEGDPHEQRRGEVERPEPRVPEAAAPEHRALHVAHRRVGAQRADQEACVHVAPGGLDEACEGREEARQERGVLRRRRRLAAAGRRERRGRAAAAHPRADERGQRDAERRQRGRRRDAVGDHTQRQRGLLWRRRRPRHAFDPRELVVVLVADHGGVRAPEDPVEEEKVVTQHGRHRTGDKN